MNLMCKLNSTYFDVHDSYDALENYVFREPSYNDTGYISTEEDTQLLIELLVSVPDQTSVDHMWFCKNPKVFYNSFNDIYNKMIELCKAKGCATGSLYVSILNCTSPTFLE